MILIIAENLNPQSTLSDYVKNALDRGMTPQNLGEHLGNLRTMASGVKDQMDEWLSNMLGLVEVDKQNYYVMNDNPENKEVAYYNFGIWDEKSEPQTVISGHKLSSLLSDLYLIAKSKNVSIGLVSPAEKFLTGNKNVMVKAPNPEMAQSVGQEIQRRMKSLPQNPTPQWLVQTTALDSHFIGWLTRLPQDQAGRIIPSLEKRLQKLEPKEQPQEVQAPIPIEPPKTAPQSTDPLAVLGDDKDLFEAMASKDIGKVLELGLGPAQSREKVYEVLKAAAAMFVSPIPPELDKYLQEKAYSSTYDLPEAWYAGEKYFSETENAASQKFFDLQPEQGALIYITKLIDTLGPSMYSKVVPFKAALEEMQEVIQQGLKGHWSLKAMTSQRIVTAADIVDTDCSKVLQINQAMIRLIESLDGKYNAIAQSNDPMSNRFKWELALLLGRARDLKAWWWFMTGEIMANCEIEGHVDNIEKQACVSQTKAASIVIAMPYVMSPQGITDLHWEYLGTGGLPRSYEDSVVRYVKERLDKIPQPFQTQISNALVRVDDVPARDEGLKALGQALIRYLSSSQGEADREMAVTQYDIHSKRTFDEKMDRIKLWVDETRRLTQELGGTDKLKELGPEGVRSEIYNRVLRRIKNKIPV